MSTFLQSSHSQESLYSLFPMLFFTIFPLFLISLFYIIKYWYFNNSSVIVTQKIKMPFNNSCLDTKEKDNIRTKNQNDSGMGKGYHSCNWVEYKIMTFE
ncbi:hypothetical protein P8452_33004 [Trifolium repens]|nr:hypothetical protein P8452_33004 [Trifolium repens]